MKDNFDSIFLNTIQSLSASGDKPKLLLHCCCAPCASGVLPQLIDKFDVCLFYYNPNTQPKEEYLLRLDELKKYLKLSGYDAPLIVGNYEQEAFKTVIFGHEDDKEGGARCSACMGLRLAETAKLAAENGFDFFGTTLTISPLKNVDVINTLGIALEKGYGVKFLVSDFKKRDGYKNSIANSQKFGLYRQNYCGCLYSINKNDNP